MATEIGKIFETQLQAVLKGLKESHLVYWHRFPDTHSAGGTVIQDQPSDYFLGLPVGSRPAQRMILFEAKASEKSATLPKSAVSPSQRGHIHRWAGLMDLPYQVVFWSVPGACLEIWDGRGFVSAGRLDPAYRLARFEAVSQGRQLDKAAAAEALIAFYGLPDKGKTVKLYRQRYGSTVI